MTALYVEAALLRMLSGAKRQKGRRGCIYLSMDILGVCLYAGGPFWRLENSRSGSREHFAVRRQKNAASVWVRFVMSIF